LGAEIGQIDISSFKQAMAQTLNPASRRWLDWFHARGRDQADVADALRPGKSGIRESRAGRRIMPENRAWVHETAANPVISASHSSSCPAHIDIGRSFALAARKMKLREIRPGNGKHLGRRIQFPRTRARGIIE